MIMTGGKMANGRVRYIKGLSTSTFDLGKKETAESHHGDDFRLFLLFFNGNVPRFSLLSHEMSIYRRVFF